MRLATFDIFDTALIRRCGRPETVLDLTAWRLFPDREDCRDEFVNWRRQGASKVGRYGTIEDIYSTDGGEEFPRFSSRELMEAEMSMEADMLMVNPYVKDAIERLRQEGWTIKFLSDMYLPSQWLRSILEREGCAKADDEVIVSCEWKARKDDGTLYKAVRERFNPKQWIHHGDNKHSDCLMARRNNVKAVKISSGFTAIEKRLMRESRNMRAGWRMNMLAGLSRAARLTMGNKAENILAADYVAPVYIPFVTYILRQARRDKIERLHFLSRDGYIMMKIAEAINPDDIELNYLFVSRRSLMRAYLSEDTERRYIEIADRRTLISRSVDTLLWQLQLTRYELKEKFGIEFGYSKILSSQQEHDFLDKIFHHPSFTPWLLQNLGGDADITKIYLKQEGLAENKRQAMVDVGWLGTSRLMINRILGKETENTIPTFYMGVRGDVYTRSYGDYYSYFAFGQLDTYATSLIENYFSASPYPTTVGYIKDDKDTVIPLFPKGKNFSKNSIISANIMASTVMARWIKDFNGLMDDDLLFRWAKVSLDSISSLSDKLDLTPLTLTAEFDDCAMARKLSAKELFNIVALGGRHTAFDRGSVALTAGHSLGRTLWRIHRTTDRIRGKIYRRFILKRK